MTESQLNSGEQNFGKLVVVCGDGANVLEFIGEALDEITFAIERELAAAKLEVRLLFVFRLPIRLTQTPGKYPPAKPGASECEPLEAVGGVADAAP